MSQNAIIARDSLKKMVYLGMQCPIKLRLCSATQNECKVEVVSGEKKDSFSFGKAEGCDNSIEDSIDIGHLLSKGLNIVTVRFITEYVSYEIYAFDQKTEKSLNNIVCCDLLQRYNLLTDDIWKASLKYLSSKKTTEKIGETLETKLGHLVVSLLDKKGVVEGKNTKKDVDPLKEIENIDPIKIKEFDFDFKSVIKIFVESETKDLTWPCFRNKHHEIGEQKPEGNCPSFVFKYGSRYLRGGQIIAAKKKGLNTSYWFPIYVNQDSYPKLVNRIFEEKPIELGYLLIYLSFAIGRNLAVLDQFGVMNVIPYSENLLKEGDSEAAQEIEDLADMILGCITNPLTHINCKLTVQELIQQGWNITVSEPEYQNDFFTIYNKNRALYANKLEKKLRYAPKTEEFNYFLHGINSNKNFTDILKAISSIRISAYTEKEQKHHIMVEKLTLDVSFAPLYDACYKQVQNKLENIINDTKDYKEFSVLDLRIFLGRLAQKARNGSHTFIANEENGLTAIEKQMLDCAISAKFIERTAEEGAFKFAQKFIRIFIDAFYTAHMADQEYAKTKDDSDNSKVISKIIEQIFEYSKPRDVLNHLEFSLAESSLFALEVLSEVSYTLRVPLIEKLIDMANTYEVKNSSRFRQELSAHILCYLLATATNSGIFTFKLQKNAFIAIGSRQLYKVQAPLLRSMMEKNKFYRLFPQEQFAKALEVIKDTDGCYYIANQPEFYFYQAFCEKKLASVDQISDFFSASIRAQYESWIGNNPKDAIACLRKAFCMIEGFNEKSFDIASAPDAESQKNAIKNLYGMHLWLYALTNLYNPNTGEDPETFITEIILNKPEEKNKVLKKILLITFYADYFQKKQNRLYKEHSNRGNMILICGAYRFVNCFFLNVKLPISNSDTSLSDETYYDLTQYVKEYEEWMKSEIYLNSANRYYWFQRRLLSYIEGWDYKDDDDKTRFENVTFLKYDNFPVSFDSFIKEPRNTKHNEK